MHSLSRKNVTAIDHMLRSLVCSIGAVSSTLRQYNTASYRHSSIILTTLRISGNLIMLRLNIFYGDTIV